jgi:serine phosphatase RsbU (regulator of sigma subunit)
MGDVYFSERVYPKALTYYNNGYLIWSELGNDVGISTSLNNLANVNLNIGNQEKAKSLALESFIIAEKLDFPMDIENASKTLSSIYKEEKNYKLALYYQDKQIQMWDIIKNAENAENTFKKGMQYEYQKESLKDSLEFQKERELQKVKLQKKETQAYALYGGIGLMLIVFLVGIRSYQRKRKDNILINQQKIEVESQKKEIEMQHIALENTHTEISDSIRYAKQIQEAILPTTEILNSYLKNGFVLYKPKDVVSGDFYWAVKVEEKIIFAAADCTGHGVPGAMVSVVCHNALNRAVREFNLIEPAAILNKTREFVIETFSSKEMEVKDGMDISLCCWDENKMELQWAGANNPLYIVREDNSTELEVVQPDKQPVGPFHMPTSFQNNQIKLNKGDIFYLFTDGFQDQFGGPNGKKYKTGKFRKFLLSIAKQDIETHGELLNKEFTDWKGDYDQIDDVCIIGVKV